MCIMIKRTARKSLHSNIILINKPVEEDISNLTLENEDSSSMAESPVAKVEKMDVASHLEKCTGATSNSNGIKSVRAEKNTETVKPKEEGAVGGTSASKRGDSGASKDSTKHQKAASTKPPPGFKYFERRRVTTDVVKDSDSESETDYNTVVKYIEPAGTLYDEKGIHIETGLDLCDCGFQDCSGCWYPCKKCGSNKCGLQCRCHRTFMFEEVAIEGYDYVLQNSLYKRKEN